MNEKKQVLPGQITQKEFYEMLRVAFNSCFGEHTHREIKFPDGPVDGFYHILIRADERWVRIDPINVAILKMDPKILKEALKMISGNLNDTL